ncbi:hypothetical protein A2755_00365 [Candidatus Wolfebacteria bacterium RIFCSPHIGHO2_01_FULL_48_22]|uniref:Peptidyl-prolyl cis-trans isomerase n=1 Tax=Candidatus Wolfebacteria bacterium RIFCSPHIGHO2_01_FULL_48_22 TaxID=1802555 RepID=A0A1F8DVU1_9BACT|nr:MAG: hypothetical protein A2755_00365 [Candidatus Wolfebacteria bacterium RIFCSPHIGHO2_01_FULL_48_22]
MKTPLFIIIGIAAVLALIIYFLIAPQSVSINQEQQTMQELQITDITTGTGDPVKEGDSVSVLYKGTLEDGTVFDASENHSNEPFTFTVGAGQVIQGWDQGLVGMQVGGKRKLVIPSELGYGNAGMQGVIPPDATLIFEVELLEIK